jgi:hypothetical protein
MLPNDPFSGKRLIFSFLLIGEVSSRGLFVRNLYVDILVLQTLKA